MEKKTLSFGSRSLVTALLVVSIVGILNFIGARNEFQFDLTKDKLNSLSDQTRKVVRELKTPIRAVYFAKLAAKEQVRPFLESYRTLNPAQFTIEYVDPDKQPSRAKQAGISRTGTLQLIAGTSSEIGAREIKVEELTEEKVTNALLKILKSKALEICVLTGHNEKSFNSQEADGFMGMKTALNDQSYEVKEVDLVAQGKLPEACGMVAIWGPNKAFFPQELKILSEYLKSGGRLLVGLDMSFGGTDAAPEINKVLSPWGIQFDRALLIDPSIRALELDASVLLVNQFSREHPVTKDFTSAVALPFSRPVVPVPEKGSTLKLEKILSTSSKAWAESSLKELSTGAVQYTAGQDTIGVLHPGILVQTPSTRIAAFGSASFANNSYSRMLNNSDLFLNAVAWVLEDESTIAIRPKEKVAGKIELTSKQGIFVFLLTVIGLPLAVASGGIGFWAYRRKL
jgi:ABC-type uncharacterized transport system involved in gliding motility auxiliary subunit